MTTKTIRHYHKVGLLQEPERTESGYRLYDAQDLLRLKQIRHMQAFGLPLKHIKTILGDTAHEHTLRDILQALDTELVSQIQVLEKRRARIRAILDEDAPTNINQPTIVASFEIVKESVGERLAMVSPAMLEMEKQFWTVIDEFDWPADYRKQKHHLTDTHLRLHYSLSLNVAIPRNTISNVQAIHKSPSRIQAISAHYEAKDQRIVACFSNQGMVLLTLSQPLALKLGSQVRTTTNILLNVDQRDELLDALPCISRENNLSPTNSSL